MKQGMCMVFLPCLLSGCMATTGNYRPLSKAYPPRPANCAIAVFKDTAPSQPYVTISQLNVHLEKTFFLPSDYASAIGELKRQACLSGADGIIGVREESSSYLETKIYNLSGTGVLLNGREASE